MQKLGNTCVRDLNVPLNVHIEGNIAAGKSSFIKHFENKPSLITLPELFSGGRTSKDITCSR